MTDLPERMTSLNAWWRRRRGLRMSAATKG